MKGEVGLIDVQPIPKLIPGPFPWVTPSGINGDWGG